MSKDTSKSDLYKTWVWLRFKRLQLESEKYPREKSNPYLSKYQLMMLTTRSDLLQDFEFILLSQSLDEMVSEGHSKLKQTDEKTKLNNIINSI